MQEDFVINASFHTAWKPAIFFATVLKKACQDSLVSWQGLFRRRKSSISSGVRCIFLMDIDTGFSDIGIPLTQKTKLPYT